MRAAVIGAGIGGLAAAIRLAVDGHHVIVYEKNRYPGGKISRLQVGNFRFDTGPSLFTLPELTEELFRLCGEDMKEHIPYERLDTNCRYFFPDGSDFTFHRDREKLAAEMREKKVAAPEKLFERLARSQEVYELSAPVFLFSNFHRLSNFNTPPYKKVAAKLRKLDFLRTMHGANGSDFRDPRLVRIFDRYATYNGSDPYRAPATLNMIAHLENNLGACFPVKGMYSIADGLYRLASRQGVEFRFSEQVERLECANGRPSWVETHRGREYYDVVVSDVDVRYLCEELVRHHPLRRRLRRAEPSSSALIFYWAVDRRFDTLELHNILFSEDYRSEFEALFKRRTVPDDPTVYIFIGSKIVGEDCPEGCENWFVMVNAPADCGQEWNALVKKTRRKVIERINSALGTDIEKHITAERTATPLSIEKETSSRGGALYGASSNSMWSAFLRHPNHLRRMGNLYFVGGSVHPGGGIPLCLASAQIACNEIKRRYDGRA